jgi:hypothetical protein
MTAKMEDKRKSQQQMNRRQHAVYFFDQLSVFLLLAVPVSKVHSGRSNLLVAHPRRARVLWLVSVVPCGCFTSSLPTACIGGYKCVCAVGQIHGRSIRRQIDTLRCNLKCFLYRF